MKTNLKSRGNIALESIWNYQEPADPTFAEDWGKPRKPQTEYNLNTITNLN